MPTGPDVPRVQVLDTRGSVVTGDPASAGQPAMYLLPAGLSRQQVTIGSLAALGGSSATVYAVRVRTPGGPETVVAAMPLARGRGQGDRGHRRHGGDRRRGADRGRSRRVAHRGPGAAPRRAHAHPGHGDHRERRPVRQAPEVRDG